MLYYDTPHSTRFTDSDSCFRISTRSLLIKKFCPFPEAQLSIATHALHDDTSVLVGIRGVPSPHNSKQIVLFHLADHCRRLSQSAKYLNIDIAPIDLEAILIEFVQRNQPQTSFYIPPLIYALKPGHCTSTA